VTSELRAEETGGRAALAAATAEAESAQAQVVAFEAKREIAVWKVEEAEKMADEASITAASFERQVCIYSDIRLHGRRGARTPCRPAWRFQPFSLKETLKCGLRC
jgi:hypothetical protein